jgi:hypothetical protein
MDCYFNGAKQGGKFIVIKESDNKTRDKGYDSENLTGQAALYSDDHENERYDSKDYIKHMHTMVPDKV